MDKGRKLLQDQAVKLRTVELKGIRDELLEQQDYRCAICNIHLMDNPGNAVLDHCHTTGFIRDVLCRNCNRGEGKVKTQATVCKREGDLIGWLAQLVSYWHRHKEPKTNWIHPTHKTEEEKRKRRNKQARERRKAKK